MKNNELVFFKNGETHITSIDLLKQVNWFRELEKDKAKLEHYDLLKIIRDEFEEEIGDGKISASYYVTSQNKKQPMFALTTSQAKQVLVRESKSVRKAVIAYIEKLEAFIREKQSSNWQTARRLGKKTRLDETDVIRDKLIPLAIEQGSTNYAKFYMTYSKMINSLLNINSDMRENLPYRYLTTIDLLERIIENIISAECDKGTHYKQIYQSCKAKCDIAVGLSFLPKLEQIALKY